MSDNRTKSLILGSDGQYFEQKGFDNDGSGNIIDTAHLRIHNGQMFMTGHYVASLADAATIVILVEAASAMHMIFSAALGGDATFTVTKGVTATTGTALTPVNKNEYSSLTSLNATAISHTPTGVSGGTAYPTVLLPGGTGGNSSGSSGQGFSSEIILKTGTNYLITLTNVSGNAKGASLVCEWYEPSNT